jgi:chromosome partitioning protein
MASIITLAQRKGGAGKTTLAAHLAAGWAVSGRRVAVLDVDPQRSLSQWVEIRRQAQGGGDVGFTAIAVSGWKLGLELDRLRRDHDVILIDSPPHAEMDSRAAIRAADLVVVPVQPSPMDLWATQATLDVARAENRPALLVLNRVAPRARLTQEIAARLSEGGVRLASTTLGNRTAFAASLAAGEGVEAFEPSGAAAGEMIRLRDEIDEALRLR